jgi:uncharacterized protein (TIGR02466 family)
MDQDTAAPVGELRQVGDIAAFTSIIAGYGVPDYASLNRDLREAIAAWRADEPGLQVSNKLGWHSPRTLFDREEEPFKVLAGHIKAGLAQSVRRYWPAFDPGKHNLLCEAWVNINGKGGYNVPHDHGTWNLAGSYYVATPAQPAAHSGLIEFLNPAGALPLVMALGSKMVQPAIRVQPQPGNMLIFPAYLRHWVYPNNEDEDRISVAFNARLLENVLD